MDNANIEEWHHSHTLAVSPMPYRPQVLENQENVAPEAVQGQIFVPYGAEPLSKASAMTFEPRKYCGMSKKIMYALIILVTVIATAAVVGGAVGGSLASKNTSKSTAGSRTTGSGCSSASCSTADATATIASSTISSVTAPTTATETPSTKLGAIAAAMIQSNGEEFIYVYYEKGASIMSTVFPGTGEFSIPQNLALLVTPKIGTPLAAAAVQGPSGALLYIHYLDSMNNLIAASFGNVFGSTSLAANTTTTIAKSEVVHEASSIAALWLPNYGWRTYYQNTAGYICECVSSDGAAWSTGSTLNADGASGTPISISLAEVPYMNLFYIGAANDELYTFGFNSAYWTEPVEVTSNALTAWNVSISSLSAASQTSQGLLRTYYIGNNRQVYEFFDSANTTWSTLSNGPDIPSNLLPLSDEMGPGAIASVGWSANIRLYYFSAGLLVQGVLTGDSPAWTEGNILSSL